MKILWWSNHPTTQSGYGTQTAIWTRKLRDEGHQVIISANYGGEPRAHEWEGIPVLPPGEDGFAQDSLGEDIAAVDPDLTWCLYDAWAIDAIKPGTHAAIWTPVDHSPLPPRVKHALETTDAIPVAMSEWGQRQLNGNGLEALYTPHGIDTEIFQPRDRAEARRRMQLDPDVFLVGIVGANKGAPHIRKGFDLAFQAISAYALTHEIHTYVHSKASAKSGADLRVMAQTYQVPSESVTFSPSALLRYGVTDTAMSWIYSAFDVLLAPSLGEGFGLPVLEAQACGTPVIVTDFSSQSELVGAGWAVPGTYLYDASQASDWMRADLRGVIDALALADTARNDLPTRMAAREFAEGYDYHVVWDKHFAGVIDELESAVSTEPIPLGHFHDALRAETERMSSRP